MQSILQQYLFLTSMFLSSNSFYFPTFDAKCKFARRQHTTFWTGGTVAGTVEYTDSEHTEWNITHISAELHGRIEFKTNFLDKKRRRGYTFSDKRFIFRSAIDSKDFLSTTGNYSWRFTFRLSKFLPPTIKQTHSKGAELTYYIALIFERPGWYRANIRKQCYIDIQHLSSLTNAKKVEEQKTNRKGVHLHVILYKNIVAVGKNISIEVNLRNPKKKLIRRITATLFQIVSGGCIRKERAVLSQQNLEGIRSFRGETFHQQLELPVPLKAASTWDADSSNGFLKCKPLVVSHKLQVEADIRGFYTNIRLEFPLTIIYMNETQN
ncbi:unnamed protein product [Adineta steineri]|uniref:Arrestin C-terminal-like domain-containing protein n=1 Tax=Adineta steineri TaxID=433720 RepID=A0A818XQL7_9BILA|nr:unnamed protein product [Adineta steineri]CAF1211184.1 unnamed protein product [Adineta steineri]CAF3737633.1 unnamed protein product [Adineta steineri]CAF3742421.1 unnamed protein product [Adineta steineri]